MGRLIFALYLSWYLLPVAIQSFPLLLALPSFVSILALSSLASAEASGARCPAVWYQIGAELRSTFVSDGQCNDMARVAIRFAFRDAGPYSTDVPFAGPAGGGADGSLVLNDDEITWKGNHGLSDFRTFIQQTRTKYGEAKVGAADLVQFAASVAIHSCPGGPAVRTVIGRADSAAAAPNDTMPAPSGPGASHDVLMALFAAKGFSPRDLAALMGAHTASRAFGQANMPVGAAQDATPGVWDTQYYAEMVGDEGVPEGVARFESDVNLSAKGTVCREYFGEFARDADAWGEAFGAAMARLSVLGIPEERVRGFVDCTDAVRGGRA